MKGRIKLKRVVASVLILIMSFGVLLGNWQIEAAFSPKLNKKSVVVAIGKTVSLKIKDKNGAKVRWSSSKKKIARVSSSGKVTGCKKGKATIVAKLVKKKKSKKLKCKVTVVKGAKSLSVTNKKGKKIKSLILDKHETVKLKSKISPKSSNDIVTWKSSDTEVATVQNGIITGQYIGKTKITATTYSGKKVTIKVTVKAPEINNTLKEAYSKDFPIGVAVNTWQLEGAGAYAKAKKLIAEQFNSITMENQMKPDSIMSKDTITQGNDTDILINEERLGKILKLASDNGLKLRGHTLVWHNQTPEWFFYEDFDTNKSYVSKEVLRQRLESYIKKVLEYCQNNYPGVVYAWDVANEVIADEGTFRTKSKWYEIYGDESYITDAFTFARKYADKDVKLFINDYNEYNTAKRDKLFSVLKELYEKGLCDGIGMQSHYVMDYPTLATVKVAIQKYNQIDPGKIEIQLTELDIHCTRYDAAGQKELAEKYGMLFEMLKDCKRNQNINLTGVTLWGLTDSDTWLTDFRGETSYPLLFDGDYAAKTAYFAVLDAAK